MEGSARPTPKAVSALSTTRQRTTLLIVVILFLVADVFLLAIRLVIRCRQRETVNV